MLAGVITKDRARRLARALGSRAITRLRELAFGFGLAESLFVAALYVIGARYVPAGPPLILVLFLVALRLADPARPRGHRVFQHALAFLTTFLILTGVASATLPEASVPQLLARVMHQAMAVPGGLAWAIWLHRHVRRAVAADVPAAVITSGRVAWLALKVSLWSGAIVALLVILEGLIPVHAVALAVALPLVTWHVVAALRWRASGTALPRGADYIAALGGRPGRVLATSGLAGVALAALMTWGPRAYDGLNLAVGRAGATVVPRADFGAGFAVTDDGAGYSPTVLAQSNACGNASCHPFVFSDWKVSPHRHTVSASYLAAVEEHAARHGRGAAGACVSCHDPISQYSGVIGASGELTTPEGRREGLSCLVCHSSRPTGGPATGAPRRLVMTFPALFGGVSLDARSMVALTPGHRAELALRGDTPGALCMTCHAIPAIPGDEPPRHAQPRMRAECRGESGCTACHMPRASRNARPGQPLAPSHTFVARVDVAAAGEAAAP